MSLSEILISNQEADDCKTKTDENGLQRSGSLSLPFNKNFEVEAPNGYEQLGENCTKQVQIKIMDVLFRN